MNSKDFIIWLKGFTEGVHQYNITPVQWETLKEQLNKVDDTPYVSNNFTIGPDGAYERDPNQPSFGTPNFIYTTGSAGWRYSTTNGEPNCHTTTIPNSKELLLDSTESPFHDKPKTQTDYQNERRKEKIF